MPLKNKDKNVKELIKGTSTALFLKLLGMFCTYVAMAFVTRHYGAEQWGVFTIGLTILNIAVILPVFGFDNSLVRMLTEIRLKGNKESVGKTMLKAVGVSLIISGVVIFIANNFSQLISDRILKDKSLEYLLKLAAIALIPLALTKLIGAFFQAFKRTAGFMLFKSVLVSVTFLLFLWVFDWFDFELTPFETYAYAIVFTMAIALMSFSYFFNKLEFNTPQESIKIELGKMLKTSYPMLLASSFGLIMGWVDVLMLKYYSTSVDVGIFNVALKLASISLFSLAAVNSIASPKFAEFYSKGDMHGLEEVVKKSTKLMFFVTAPFLLILVFFPKAILGIFGEEFVSGYTALIFLCIARFINSISGSVGFLMQMTDNQKIFQNVMLLALVINVVLNIVLIPEYGFTGVAFASAIAMIFWNIVLVILIKKKLGFWTMYMPFLAK